MTRAWIAALVLVLAGAARAPAQTAPPAAPSSDAPALTVVLLLDVSASMTLMPLPFDQRYAQVFNAFQQGLAPGDHAAVGVVASDVRFTPLTADSRELSAAVRGLLRPPGSSRLGPSPIWDAVDAALPLAAARGGRAAVVLFSDGKAAGNLRGLDEVIARARRLNVSVSAVIEGPGTMLLARSTSTLDPADAVVRLTEATGGTSLVDRPPDPRQRNPGPMIALIMDGLRR